MAKVRIETHEDCVGAATTLARLLALGRLTECEFVGPAGLHQITELDRAFPNNHKLLGRMLDANDVPMVNHVLRQALKDDAVVLLDGAVIDAIDVLLRHFISHQNGKLIRIRYSSSATN